jgi:hypothetical protein
MEEDEEEEDVDYEEEPVLMDQPLERKLSNQSFQATVV